MSRPSRSAAFVYAAAASATQHRLHRSLRRAHGRDLFQRGQQCVDTPLAVSKLGAQFRNHLGDWGRAGGVSNNEGGAAVGGVGRGQTALRQPRARRLVVLPRVYARPQPSAVATLHVGHTQVRTRRRTLRNTWHCATNGRGGGGLHRSMWDGWSGATTTTTSRPAAPHLACPSTRNHRAQRRDTRALAPSMSSPPPPPVKILLCGDVLGRLGQLYKRFETARQSELGKPRPAAAAALPPPVASSLAHDAPPPPSFR